MTKTQFIISLSEKLSALPKAEAEERLRFYAEMIEDRMEDGLSEEEAVAAVGTVDEIAAQILQVSSPTAKPVPKKSMGTAGVLALILGAPLWFSLLLAAFAVVISLYASLWAVLISLWAVCVSFAVTSVCGWVYGAVQAICVSVPIGLIYISISLFFAGTSILLYFGCKALTKYTITLTKFLIARIKGYCSRKEVK